MDGILREERFIIGILQRLKVNGFGPCLLQSGLENMYLVKNNGLRGEFYGGKK